jgi:hypothetical protein
MDFESVPYPARVLFDTICDVAQDLGMRAAEPKVTESQGFFRGVINLHTADMQAGGQIEVAGSGQTAKVLITPYSATDPAAAASSLEAELSRRFDLAPYRRR